MPTLALPHPRHVLMLSRLSVPSHGPCQSVALPVVSRPFSPPRLIATPRLMILLHGGHHSTHPSPPDGPNFSSFVYSATFLRRRLWQHDLSPDQDACENMPFLLTMTYSQR